MSENHEPSYYEIALTNRQVMVAFVLILGSVLAAFLGGVWLGRQGSEPLLARELEAPDGAKPADEVAQVDDLQFFSESPAAAPAAPAAPRGAAEARGQQGQHQRLKKPDLSPLLDAPNPNTTLAEDVGSADTASPSPPPPPPSPPARQAAARRGANGGGAKGATRVADRDPEKAAARRAARAEAKPASPPPFAADDLVIQVFSSRDEAQAKKIQGELSSQDFPAYISPVTVDGTTMYRVRIGPYQDRALAEKAAANVNRRFKLDTWVTAASN